MRVMVARVASVLMLAAVVSCGGGSPSPSAGGGSGGGGSAATITITASGVSPKAVTVNAGSQVSFVNNDSVTHEMASDPHPEHTDCPEINTVGTLVPGQTRQTSNLNTMKTCGYHDHLRDGDQALRGTITIR